MVQYKLNYFNIRGRGEVIRLVFAAAGQKYQDNRIEFAQWNDLKAKTPFGQLPYLEIHDNGHVTNLAQSITITRYLARKFGLAGKNDLESAEIEMYGDQVTDLQNEIIRAHFEKDETRKKELNDKLITQTVPNTLKAINDRLAKTGSGFLASSGLSWGDLHLYSTLDFFGPKKDEILANPNFKNVKTLVEKVAAHPNVSVWLKNRPKTDM